MGGGFGQAGDKRMSGFYSLNPSVGPAGIYTDGTRLSDSEGREEEKERIKKELSLESTLHIARGRGGEHEDGD